MPVSYQPAGSALSSWWKTQLLYVTPVLYVTLRGFHQTWIPRLLPTLAFALRCYSSCIITIHTPPRLDLQRSPSDRRQHTQPLLQSSSVKVVCSLRDALFRVLSLYGRTIHSGHRGLLKTEMLLSVYFSYTHREKWSRGVKVRLGSYIRKQGYGKVWDCMRSKTWSPSYLSDLVTAPKQGKRKQVPSLAYTAAKTQAGERGSRDRAHKSTSQARG